jgi:hypothetical protein
MPIPTVSSCFTSNLAGKRHLGPMARVMEGEINYLPPVVLDDRWRFFKGQRAAFSVLKSRDDLVSNPWYKPVLHLRDKDSRLFS